MKLEDFEKALHQEAVKFAADWKKSHRKDPTNWPLDLPEGEWWEQFVTFLGNTGRGPKA
jgi:hypothetical protein